MEAVTERERWRTGLFDAGEAFEPRRKQIKKVLDKQEGTWYDIGVVTKERQTRKTKKFKKFLTSAKRYDKISELSKTDRNLDNWTVKHILESSEKSNS